MVQLKSKPIADFIGTVTHAYPANQNPDTGKWRPANFKIETEGPEGKEELVKQFPTSVWDGEQSIYVTPEPITMPAWYENLIVAYGSNMRSLEGCRVMIKGEGSINNKTMNVEYTVVGENFTVLGDSPTPEGNTPEPPDEGASTPPSEQPRTYSLDERIAWNSAVNNANIALSSRWAGSQSSDGNGASGSLYNPELPGYAERVRKVAMPLYEVIRHGPVEPVKDTEEAQEPEATTLDSF